MRGAVFWVGSIAGLIGIGLAGPAAAAPTPSTPAAPVAVPGKAVCTIADNKLIELSGMAATDTGYVVINDGSQVAARNRVFFLDKSCQTTKSVPYPSPSSRDPEDVAIGRDGTIWVADIGDNDKNRANVALWKFPASGSGTATLYRLRYPDGKHDAETLILGLGDQPVIVTKDAGVSGLYVPSAPLQPSSASSQGVLLTKVGEFKPQRTGTSNPRGFIFQTLVSGGANSPDRTKVVLRTYADAYEWDVADGDVVKAITTGKPRITPLPDEPQGEAITYSRDGATFLTVSETADLPADELPKILQYTPVSSAKPAPTAAAGAPVAQRNTLSWYERLSLTEVTSLIAGVGGFGVLLVLAGVIGIMRARRSRVGRRSGGTREGGSGQQAGQFDGDNEPTAVMAAVRDPYEDQGGYRR